jgi:uncharacterized protein YegJ (DUF2314 family)
MSDKKIFYSKNDDPEMIKAYQKAQETFKYFWRELSWEYRRIIPALDLACVKIAFQQDFENGEEPVVEHMWINEIEFDGDIISGVLINEPNELTNVENGDAVDVSVDQISDWLFATRNKTYGGFTIHAMRSSMSEKERKEHDKAWGLNFGDYNDVLVVHEQKEHPENLIEHPMSKNMNDSLTEFLQANPSELTNKDELGYTILHRETIAGNQTSISVLLQAGIDVTAKTNDGKTALDFAKQLNWTHLISLLESK